MATTSTTPQQHHYAPILVLPFVLIAAGIVALLANTGVITWDSLARIAGLWPLLLILIGIELIISRIAPVVVALVANIAISAVAVVGIVALLVSGASFTIGGWWSTANLQTITRSAVMPAVTQAQLNVNYGAAQLTIHAGNIGNDLYQARLSYAGNPAPSVWVDNATGTVHVDRGNRAPFQIVPSGAHETVDLTINNRVPWSMTLNTGASSQTIDLRSLTLTNLRINAGASSAEIDLPQPNGVVPVRIDGGAMSMHLVAPTGVAVRVTASGGFNSMVCDGQQVSGMGHQTWTSANYSGSSNRYDVTFAGGASSFRLERW